MDIPIALTIESEFQLRLYESEIKVAEPEDLRELLIKVLRQNLVKDQVIRHLLRNES